MSVKSTLMTGTGTGSASKSTTSSHHPHSSHPSHRKRPSNIGKNPNPVLVMAPTDQKTLVNASHFPALEKSADLPLDNAPAPVGNTIRFGGIVKATTIDYSQIAALHKSAPKAETTEKNPSPNPNPRAESAPKQEITPTAAPKQDPRPTAVEPEVKADQQPLLPPKAEIVPEPQPQRMFPVHPHPQMFYPQRMMPPMGTAGGPHQFMYGGPPPPPPPFAYGHPQALYGQPMGPPPQVMMGFHHPPPPQMSVPLLPPVKKHILDFTDPVSGASIFDEREKEVKEEKVAESVAAEVVENVVEVVQSVNAEVNVQAEVQPQSIPQPQTTSQIPQSSPAEPEVEIIVDSPTSPTTHTHTHIHAQPLDLCDNSSISYPPSLPTACLPELRPGRRRVYSLEFLELFEQLCESLPPGCSYGEYLTTFSGPMSINYLASSGASSSGPHSHHPRSSRRDSRQDSSTSSGPSASGHHRSGTDRGQHTSRPGSSNSSSNRNNPASRPDKRPSGGPSSRSSSHISAPAVPIHTSENSWSKAAKEAPTDEQTLTKKKFVGILNKLSKEHFESLYAQIKALPFSNSVLYGEVIGKIYDKAVDEPAFAEMYAKLVQRLSEDFRTFPDVDPGVVAKTGSVTRSLILGRCQREWKRRSLWALPQWDQVIEAAGLDLSSPSPIDKPEDMSIEAYWRTKLKKRSLGNVRFVGELYKLGVIHENIILSCLHGLLEPASGQLIAGDEELECLARLLTTTGHRLDCEKLKNFVDSFFATIAALAQDMGNTISSRVRFMLLDLIDLRAARWNPAVAKKQQSKKPTAPSAFKGKKEHSAAATPLLINSQSKYSLLAGTSEEELPHFAEWDSVEAPRLIKSCLREYLTTRDRAEVELSIREDFPWDPCLVVEEITRQTLEAGKAADIDALVQLIGQLEIDALVRGVEKGMEQLEDIVIDAPQARVVAERIRAAVAGRK